MRGDVPKYPQTHAARVVFFCWVFPRRVCFCSSSRHSARYIGSSGHAGMRMPIVLPTTAASVSLGGAAPTASSTSATTSSVTRPQPLALVTTQTPPQPAHQSLCWLGPTQPPRPLSQWLHAGWPGRCLSRPLHPGRVCIASHIGTRVDQQGVWTLSRCFFLRQYRVHSRFVWLVTHELARAMVIIIIVCAWTAYFMRKLYLATTTRCWKTPAGHLPFTGLR